MRRDLIRRLIALEASAPDVRVGKTMLPAWLLEDLVNQGARLDARGQLDLAWLLGESGGLSCSPN
jgi:hypothetical protein